MGIIDDDNFQDVEGFLVKDGYKNIVLYIHELHSKIEAMQFLMNKILDEKAELKLAHEFLMTKLKE